MPISVVVGGQFGSEGKGKVALDIAVRRSAVAVVRVGGTNSGHTAVWQGVTYAFRQLPASALTPGAIVVLPAGSLIDIGILTKEVAELGLTPERLKIDPKASVISEADKAAEQSSGLIQAIGSTASGTGAALCRRLGRADNCIGIEAAHHPALAPYLADTNSILRNLLSANGRVVIEGTQGFGLSVFHGGYYPKATSRDTTAGTFVGEAGLSPLDVDEVALVIRTFPIRVAGDSGPRAMRGSW